MTTQLFRVTGMTCGDCVHTVSEEIAKIPGVSEVVVDVVADGISILAVTALQPLDAATVSAALDEAGDYHLADA